MLSLASQILIHCFIVYWIKLLAHISENTGSIFQMTYRNIKNTNRVTANNRLTVKLFNNPIFNFKTCSQRKTTI